MTAGDSVRLLNENLHGALSVPESPKPLQLVNRSELPAGQSAASQVAYLRFAPSIVGENIVSVALEARMVRTASGAELGLSRVQVEFNRVGEGWIPGGPTLSAS